MIALADHEIFWQKSGDAEINGREFSGRTLTHLNAGGRHLRRLVVDPEPVPARRQRVVADQVLDGRVLDLRGVEVHAAIGTTQSPVASWVTLWSWEDDRDDIQQMFLC